MEQRPPAGGPEASATNLVITFRNAGVAEVREASRIAIDGSGRLILYQGTRPGECLVLSRIRELRISPVRQHDEAGPLPPGRRPDRDFAGHASLPN